MVNILKKIEEVESYPVSFSLLSDFGECKQKAQHHIDWKHKGFNYYLSYGSIIGVALEHLFKRGKVKAITPAKVRKAVDIAFEKWFEDDNNDKGADAQQFAEWIAGVAEALLIGYGKHWRRDDTALTCVAMEYPVESTFRVETYLGREVNVPIIGYIDGLFKKKSGAHIMRETKTKGRWSEEELLDQLDFDFQIQMYCYFLFKQYKIKPKTVEYDVIRRPQLRLNISKGETPEELAERVAEDISARPDFYYARYDVPVDRDWLDSFEHDFKQFITDYASWRLGEIATFKNRMRCFGRYGPCDFIPICARGDTLKFRKRNKKERQKVLDGRRKDNTNNA